MREVLRPTWGLVLGGSDGLGSDVERLESLLEEPWPGVVVAANNAGVDWPRDLDHWVSFHPEKFQAEDPANGTGNWLARRKAMGYSGGYETWARRAPALVDHVIPAWGGMSKASSNA